MASVPGPQPNRPLPTPGVSDDPPYEREREDAWEASPEEAPPWESEPFDPQREYAEEGAPAPL
jgi:hypothetical protein